MRFLAGMDERKKFPTLHTGALLSGIRIHEPIELINFSGLGFSYFLGHPRLSPRLWQ